MYLIATDGGARDNGKGVSAWAFVVFDEDEFRKGSKSKGYPKSCGYTNNAMELQAIIEALRWVEKAGQPAKIFTDSQYAVKGIEEWMDGWVKRGWRTAQGRSVKNEEKWKTIRKLLQVCSVEFQWVPGHACGNHFEATSNRAADALCNMRMDEEEFDDYLNMHTLEED